MAQISVYISHSHPIIKLFLINTKNGKIKSGLHEIHKTHHTFCTKNYNDTKEITASIFC